MQFADDLLPPRLAPPALCAPLFLAIWSVYLAQKLICYSWLGGADVIPLSLPQEPGPLIAPSRVVWLKDGTEPPRSEPARWMTQDLSGIYIS